ncbi:tyrosine-type recombinase/integrase [bacterium]|nr:tyrosine-type recombinase/integrase [bacterium]
MQKDYLNIIPFDLPFPPVDNSLSMRGRVRTKEKCQTCKSNYTELPRGIVCTQCGTTPKKFFVDLGRFKGERIRIYSDDTGAVLDSFARAHRVLENIRYQIDKRTFDPRDYCKKEAKAFWFEVRVYDWLRIKEQDVESGTLSPAYLKDLRISVNKYFLDFFSPTEDIREINTPRVNLFFRSIPNAISLKTKKNILGNLRAFMSFLKRDGWIRDLPDFPKVETIEPTWKWIDMETQDKILDNLPDRYKPIIFFLMRHGVRPGEGTAIKWKDVDLEKEIVTIQRTFSLGELRERTKTKRIRFLPLHSETVEWMKKQHNRFPESFVFAKNTQGEPLTPGSLRKAWRRAIGPLGLNLRLYDGTRHSFGSQAANAGTPINIIQDALGHTTPSTTKRYAHTNLESIKKIVEPIDKVVPMTSKPKARKSRKKSDN